MSTAKVKRRVGSYELGRTIGEGTFAKVRFARNSETGEAAAIKILDKEKVLKHKLVEQLKREIATMKLIKHPNVVRLYEVIFKTFSIHGGLLVPNDPIREKEEVSSIRSFESLKDIENRKK